jgi:hypothetical protein
MMKTVYVVLSKDGEDSVRESLQRVSEKGGNGGETGECSNIEILIPTLKY